MFKNMFPLRRIKFRELKINQLNIQEQKVQNLALKLWCDYLGK